MRNVIKSLLLVFTFTATVVLGASDAPEQVDYGWLAITRVSTSVAYAMEHKDDDAGYDLGDTEESVTLRYGGSPFEFGNPLDVEIILSNPPAGDSWSELVLQYAQGDKPADEDWITADRVISGLELIEGRRTSPFRYIRPLTPGPVLIRVYAVTTSGAYTSIPDMGVPVQAKGDGLTWLNREVVKVQVRPGLRPGTAY